MPVFSYQCIFALKLVNPLDKNILRQQALAEIFYEQKIIEVFELFGANGIEPILIKGWSIGRFYPVDKRRGIGDIDLSVYSKDYRKAKELIEKPENLRFSVDLHNGLRRLDKLPFENLFQNSQLVALRETNIRVLRHEDNLRLTCIHWLTDGGANEKRLWDVYYLVANRPADFDWERCLDVSGRRRRQWIICTIALAHRYLGLNVDETPIADEVKNGDVLPKWLVRVVEREWRDEIKISPLHKCLHDGKLFRQQLRKRFTGNAIMSSVNTEAPFDDSSRLPYQIADFGLRLVHSIPRVIPAVFAKLRLKAAEK